VPHRGAWHEVDSVCGVDYEFAPLDRSIECAVQDAMTVADVLRWAASHLGRLHRSPVSPLRADHAGRQRESDL